VAPDAALLADPRADPRWKELRRPRATLANETPTQQIGRPRLQLVEVLQNQADERLIRELAVQIASALVYSASSSFA
jgi:hypothetical protein